MNSFLRNVEAQRLREHEERILSMRGEALPRQNVRDERTETAEGRAELTRQIVALAKAEPHLSATQIAQRVESSHPTVIRELRKAGLYVKRSRNQHS